jgi:tetratricopeptide (TPR) repeat protein
MIAALDDQIELNWLLAMEPDSDRLLGLAMAVAQRDPAAGHEALRAVAEAVAARPGRRGTYLLTRYNQGALERDAGEHDAALATWSEALEHGVDLGDSDERFARTVIEFNYANLLNQLAGTYQSPDLRERALTTYDELIARERDSTVPGTRDRVARAAVNRVLACAESGSTERTQAALADVAALAEAFDSDELRTTAANMAVDFGREQEILAPWSARTEGPEAAHLDALHQEALQRLGRHQRFGEPYVLLLRSFGRISVEAGSLGGVPMVSATIPGVSVGHPLEAALVRWLEQRALVVAVAHPGGTLMDEEDGFPRLALGDDWYAFVQQLVLGADAIVVMATEVSPGLAAETRAIDWLARAEDTVLITGPGVDPAAFGSFPHRLRWEGDAKALESDLQLTVLLARLDRIRALPVPQRLAAADVAGRTRRAAAAAHQTHA